MCQRRGKRARAEACRDCRIRKKRCVPGTLNGSCRLCQSLSIPCSLDHSSIPKDLSHPNSNVASFGLAPKPSLQSHSPEMSRSPNTQTLQWRVGVERQVVYELVSYYFKFIHNVAHTIFHQDAFMNRLESDKISDLHLFAIFALTARFSNNSAFEGTNPRSRGKRYAEEAQRLFRTQLISPSLETVQACIILLTYHGAEGESQEKHIYSGLARSHAEAISLWQVRGPIKTVVQEEQRRTWLSVCIIDQWSADDLVTEPPISPSATLNNVPPLPRKIGLNPIPSESVLSQDSSELSEWLMWLQMGALLPTFADISRLLRQLSHGNIDFESFGSEATYLARCLDEWTQRLPAGFTFNSRRVMYFSQKRIGRTFLAMHMAFHHFRQMLHFPFLDARSQRRHNNLAVSVEATARDGIQKCKDSASAVTDLIKASTDVEDCELKYFVYAHIVVISSCVHLHTLIFNDDEMGSNLARQRLMLNFQYLMALKSEWPVVDVSATRLKIFQNNCRITMSDPFTMDNWMARFLTEHTSVLSDRPNSTTQLASHEPSARSRSNDTNANDGVTIGPGNSTGDSLLEELGREEADETDWASVFRFTNSETLSSDILLGSIF